MHRVASSAISLVMLSSIAGTQIATNNSVHLSAQPKPPTTTVAPREQQPAAQPATPAPVIVTVQPGDTLSGIAAANGTTYARLYDANDSIADPNVINPGQQLRIPLPDEQLPDRLATQQAVAVTAAPSSYVSAPRTVSRVSYPAVSGNDAKAFIYSHESGNNPNATSPNGCYGLGQDCNGRVRAQCGADYACQDAYFTNYANSRYGGWDGAVAFWQTHGWW